ncbi:MAG: NAD(P)-dependent oxidoreductase [Magnetococcales bacterium]|nr:NAD(P)-dependent oxidoreductase [Magnetococcales bacterium]
MPPVCLITGATGYVGSRLARALMGWGWTVHAVVRRMAPLPAGVTAHLHDGTTEGLGSLLERVRPEVVLHLAAVTTAQHRQADVTPMVEANLLFATQLLEAMARHGVTRLVNTGSFWQHHDNRDYGPVNLYAATKQAFEEIVTYYVEAFGMRAITLHLSNTYGPDDPRRMLFALLAGLKSDSPQLAMSPGEQKIDLIHIDDVTSAFRVAAERLLAGQGIGHERFAVSSGQAVRIKDLVRMIEDCTGRRLPVLWGGRPYHPREMMQPWDKGERLPGWSPEVSLAEGIVRSLPDDPKIDR